MIGPITAFVFVCLVLFYFWLLKTITRFLSIVFVILLWHDVRVGLSHWMSFSLRTYACVLSYDVLYFWLRTFIHLHITIALAWPIMGDIEPISLGSEIWLREFETVTHLLMIRAVPRSLPAPWLCFDLYPFHYELCITSSLRPLYDLSILGFSSFPHSLSDSTR